MSLPTEIYDTIAFYVEYIDNFVLFGSGVEYRRYAVLHYESRRRLAILRLVNKSFSHSASPRLFRHIVATAGDNERLSPLTRLRELSRSPYAIHVRQIDIGFQCSGDLAYEHHSAYVEDLARVLPGCLVRLPNLKAIEFKGPPASLPQEETKIFVNTVVAAFRHVPLLNLTELHVKLLTTHDFERLFSSNASSLRIPIEHVLQGLRHLGLHVSVNTNYQEQLYLQGPDSSEYAVLLNEIHTAHWFKHIELAVNLDSLELSSTDMLNLDNVQFASSLRLKVISLTRMAISSHKLLSLIEQGRDSIRIIRLQGVQLTSGSRLHVLRQISKLPHLLDFNINSWEGSLTGKSSHLLDVLLAPVDEPLVIKCKESIDYYALGNLQRQVNTNRVAAGFSPISEPSYRYLGLQTLKSALAPSDFGT